jgi:hypothetical protein
MNKKVSEDPFKNGVLKHFTFCLFKTPRFGNITSIWRSGASEGNH